MNKRFSLLFLCCIFSVSAHAFDKAKLDAYLKALKDNDKAMLSVAILENDKPVYQNAIGFANVETKQKANTDTQYRIGSITKIVTATMIFQLIDEHKLDLETKLSAFYPDIKNADNITISMLLSHRSGIHNFTDLPDYTQYMARSKTKAEMIEIIEKLSSDFVPGSQASYSNSGYVLLGFIIEEITGESYASQLQQRITNKLHLDSTRFGGPLRVKDNQANSYVYDTSGWAPATVTDLSIPQGAGAIVSTPTDVATFLSALFEGKLISASSLEKMKAIRDGYGRGLFKFQFYDKTAYGHTGGIDGFSSQAAYIEADNVAFALMANGVNYAINEISIGILSIYYDQKFHIPSFHKKSVDLTKSELVNYEGTFASQDLPLKITLKVHNGKLTAQATGQPSLILTPYSSSEFRFEPAGITIIFKTSGNKVDYSAFELKQGGGSFAFIEE